MSEEASNFIEVNEDQSENAEALSEKRNTNCKDADSDVSDELFSDEDEAIEANRCTPEVRQLLDDCSFSNSFGTPVLYSEDTIPGRAVVPSTPSSLAPFISKINEPWTSELETPDAKLAVKSKVSSAERINYLQIMDQSSSSKKFTPVLENMKYENTELLSPILNKNVRRRPKRRIFRSNTFESAEIPQNLEKRIQDEESNQNEERLQENKISLLLGQSKTETNNPYPISTQDSQKSSPKCHDSNILQPNVSTEISRPSTSSAEKSLGDIVKDIKCLQKKRRLPSEMNLANFSEIDLFKDAIQLERASTKFSHSTTEVPVTISEIGLVPFSQYCLKMSEESSNVEINAKQQKKKENSKGKEGLKEKENQKKRENIRSFKKHSTHSNTVKIFNSSSGKSFQKPSSESIITLKDEEEIMCNENMDEDLQFSQWLYISKGDEKKNAKEITESRNSEKGSKPKDEDIEIVTQFDNKLSKKDPDKGSDIGIIKQVSAGCSKSPTIYNCGFSTAKGKRIQINENKLQKAKSIFKDVENIGDIDLDNEFIKDFTPDSEKQSNLEILKQVSKEFSKELPCCGFSTAEGKPLQLNEEKLRTAKSLFRDVENIEGIDLSSQSPKKLLQFDNKLSKKDPDKGSDIQIIKQVSAGCSKSSTIPNYGFSTAKGKRIQINEDKLQQAKSIFKDVENTDVDNRFSKDLTLGLEKPSNIEVVQQVSTEFSKESSCYGFSTAKGKSIQINEDNLRKANSVQEISSDSEKSLDVDIIKEISEKSIKERTIEDIDLIAEFTKDVTPQDLKKSSDINRKSNLLNLKPISLDFKKEIPKATTSSGFSTAKGTSIKINNEKLRIAGMIFKDVEDIEGVFESASEENQFTKPHNVLESQQKGVPKLEERLISGFSVASVKTDSISEAKNFISEMKNNSVTGFATASGKNIFISEQKLMRAKKMYDETETDDLIRKDKGLNNTELTDKENQVTSSPVKFILASTSKVHTSPNTDLLHKHAYCMKRKPSEEVSRLSKRLRTSDVIARKSLGSSKSFNPVIVKSISKIQVDNQEIDSNVVKDIEKLPKCDLIVPEVRTLQCGFATAGGKKIVISDEKKLMAEKLYENVEVDDINASSSKSVAPKRNFSLPGTFQNKESVHIKKRRSLQTESCTVKDIEQLRNEFQQTSRDALRNNLLIKPSISQCKSVPIPESPPFSGFDIKDSVKSASLILKSKEFWREKGIKLSETNESELGKSLSKISGLYTKVSEDKSEMPVLFATAAGKKISINKDTLSKAQLLYSNENLSDSETVGLIPAKINTNSTKTVRLSQEALQKELELSEFSLQLKPVTSGQKLVSNPTLKRGIDDVGGKTPLGRNFASNSKKSKFTDDFQGRKLFSEDSESDNEIVKNSANQATSSSGKCKEQTSTSVSPILSKSIIKSVEIVEKDLKDFNEARQSLTYNSEIEKEKENSSEDATRSPILVKKKSKRRTKDLKTVEEEFVIKKEERCDFDVNTDSRTKSQSVETQSVSDSDILERRIFATFEQEKIIAMKKKQRPKPIKGSMLQSREENRNSRISLHQFSSGSAPTTRSLHELKERGIDPDVLDVSASTAECYKFRITDLDRIPNINVISLDVGDGARLVLDESGSAGVMEFERAFEASPGVDPRLLPPGWVKNHYRWIVWKLASMDRVKLGSADIPKMLTPDRVMKDLKYRYDREIDGSQRSAIRKILEKDDVPSKRMVLCIAAIKESSDNEKGESDPRILLRTPRWKVEVTDGWYSLPVSFDAAMVKKIIDGKVQEGTKIMTYGAELMNCERGCFPLEKSADVWLKIHTNCTRRARWDAKLGYQCHSGPIPTSLKTIDPNGGLVGKVTVVVSRIYPILFREKTSDGKSIYRNAKNEEKAQTAYQQACQSQVEAIVAKLQERYEGKQNSSEEDSAESLTNYNSASCLTESQKQKLMYSLQAKEERLQQKIAQEIEANRPPTRNVVPVQKVRIVEGETNAILTIWSKSEEVSILKEGGSISIFSISAYGNSSRDGDLNLTASRQAVFKSEPTLELSYPSRVYTALKDVAIAGFESPYCELDTVGIITWIGNTPHGMKNFEAVCVSYPNEDSSSTHLPILFWQGLSSHGFSNILTIGSLIACSNLEFRRTRNPLWSIPVCYCSERTVFTQNPRQPHLLEAFEDLKRQISDPIAYTKKCGEEISSLVSIKSVSRVSAQGTSDSTPVSGNSGFNSPNFSMSKKSLDVDTPAKSSATQKRLERLASYGQPPELSPIVFRNSSNVRSNFRPVIRTPDSVKSEKIPRDST